MASTALHRRRARRRRGERELTELNWGERDPRAYDESDDDLTLEDDDDWGEAWEDEDENWGDDWEDWGPPPGAWDEDDLA